MTLEAPLTITLTMSTTTRMTSTTNMTTNKLGQKEHHDGESYYNHFKNQHCDNEHDGHDETK